MSPTHFYDLGYVSPYGFQGFEYSRQDPYNNVDMSVFYHDSMLETELFDEEGLAMIERYKQVPSFMPHLPNLPLEFDHGTKLPGFFVRLDRHFNRCTEEILNAFADILGVESPGIPPIHLPLWLDDVGIYPKRGASNFRFMMSGPMRELKAWADEQGCVGTDIIGNDGYMPGNNAINFDWDGKRFYNITYHSPYIYANDPWVVEREQDATARIHKLFGSRPHNIVRHVKIGLSPTFAPDYMKAYFTAKVPAEFQDFSAF